eukprot:3476595-Heterocapsa_arctica.AAC.1
MMTDLARSHPRRGASHRLKRRFLTSCVDFGAVPSRLRSWLLPAKSRDVEDADEPVQRRRHLKQD